MRLERCQGRIENDYSTELRKKECLSGVYNQQLVMETVSDRNRLPGTARRIGRCVVEGTYSRNLNTGLFVLPESYSDQSNHLN